MDHIVPMKCFRPIIGVVVAALSSACQSVGAYRAESLSGQKRTILGTWNCTFKIGQKIIPTDKFQYSFSKNNLLQSDLQIGGTRVVTKGTWRIDKGPTLLFPGKKDIMTRNLTTGVSKTERIGKTAKFELSMLTANRLIFSSKESGKTASCRR